MKNAAIYENYGDVMIDVMKSPNNMVRVVAFYPETHKYFTGALYVDGSGNLYLDHLPQSGYSHSLVDYEDVRNGKVLLIKCRALSYEDAVFCNGGVLLLDCNDCTLTPWNGTWENRGYYCTFTSSADESSEARTYSASDYGEKYLFLEA